MVDYAISIMLTSLMSAFIILLLTKLGIIEWMQIHGIMAKSDKMNDLFSKLASCHFCLAFWIGLLISIVVALLTAEWQLLIMPFFTAPITRFIL